MNKQELAERLAKQSHRSRAEAADAVDNLVYEIIKDLQKPAEKSTKDQGAGLPKLPSITPIRRK
jgi:nucleoid DNA-binding protein